MSKVVFENKLEEAIELLNNGESYSENFGRIDYYNINQLLEKFKGLQINKILGLRTFWGLQQNNEAKYEDNWAEKMLEVELKVSDMDEFKNCAFFHHVFISKNEK